MANKEKPLESVTGFSCPNCGAICSHETMQSQTEPEFNDGTETNSDPCYKWIETHKCQNCETIYTINNGT